MTAPVEPFMEQQIRTLIERWAEAVHGGDLDTVLADHGDDIVMFDVPPPHDGVRGLAVATPTRAWNASPTSDSGSRSVCAASTTAGW